jgi:hypothetical protein
MRSLVKRLVVIIQKIVVQVLLFFVYFFVVGPTSAYYKLKKILFNRSKRTEPSYWNIAANYDCSAPGNLRQS